MEPELLEALKKFLKENLSIRTDHQWGSFGCSDSITIKLILGDEEISSDFFELPKGSE
jgi:hypothetical protein